jgi:hypothetical protein
MRRGMKKYLHGRSLNINRLTLTVENSYVCYESNKLYEAANKGMS